VQKENEGDEAAHLVCFAVDPPVLPAAGLGTCCSAGRAAAAAAAVPSAAGTAAVEPGQRNCAVAAAAAAAIQHCRDYGGKRVVSVLRYRPQGFHCCGNE
jgi:hypothetical protein